jgi:hypothetical protein
MPICDVISSIAANRLEGRNPNSVFKTTLADLMTLQAKNYPHLDVPAVLVKLCDAIRDLRGLEREGIFRQTANKESLDVLKLQLDQGNLEFKASSLASVDVPAAVLKSWLR